MTSYINERLEIGIVYETTGSAVGWDTTIINRDNGYYLPIERQSDSIGRWNIGDRRFSKSEWEYLFNFFYNVRGSAIAFKYKDWGDYEAINQAIATGNGTLTQFQLTKTYGDYYKPIYKPVTGTVKIYLNGTLQTSGYTVNSVGLITFAIAPASGVAISANFQFDLVVRFENDSLPSRFDAYDPNHIAEALYNVPAIYLIEVLPIDANTFLSQWKCQDGICFEDPTGAYNSRSECEGALIPPTFSGGQMEGANYRIQMKTVHDETGAVLYWLSSNNNIGTLVSSTPFTDAEMIADSSSIYSRTGKILKISPAYERFRQGYNLVTSSGTVTDAFNFPSKNIPSIYKVVLSSGAADTGGNPPPTCPI